MKAPLQEVLRSPGQPLSGAMRSFMESRFAHDAGGMRLDASGAGCQASAFNRPGDSFEREADRIATAVTRPRDATAPGTLTPPAGFDFRSVRIHADEDGADAARAVRAHAFTSGHHVVFGAGQYAETDQGRWLLAHELAHVVQQSHSLPTPAIQRMDWGLVGGKCCNESPEGDEWGVIGDGSWQRIGSGGCTGTLTDCDGMTCGGGFYQIGNLSGGVCRTPRVDSDAFREKRWTPTAAKSDARSPQQRGSREGNIPPGYAYDAE